MSSVQGHVIFPVAVRAKQTKVHTAPAIGPLRKYKISSGFWGVKGISCGKTNVGNRLRLHNAKVVKCSFSSSSNGNGSTAENSNENEAEFVNCSVTDAVEVKSSSEDGYMIKMCNGRHLRCAHNNPDAGNPPEYSPNPAIVLKIEDGTGLLLPVIVLEMQSALLILALRNVEIARPTMYEVVMEMIEKMGYEAKLVRITKRVHEAYFSQLYLTKLGDETQNITFDLRPSDAINIAVRCKVPIQVNRNLAYRDGMRVIESAELFPGSSSDTDGVVSTELDRPSGQLCLETKEFDLLRNMLVAAIEERYRDAAEWRDKLIQFRSNMNWA